MRKLQGGVPGKTEQCGHANLLLLVPTCLDARLGRLVQRFQPCGIQAARQHQRKLQKGPTPLRIGVTTLQHSIGTQLSRLCLLCHLHNRVRHAVAEVGSST